MAQQLPLYAKNSVGVLMNHKKKRRAAANPRPPCVVSSLSVYLPKHSTLGHFLAEWKIWRKRATSLVEYPETHYIKGSPACFALFSDWYSRRESNPDPRFRKPMFYPLNYRSKKQYSVLILFGEWLGVNCFPPSVLVTDRFRAMNAQNEKINEIYSQ